MHKKNILLLSLTSFFTDTATSMITSVLPVYIVYYLHAGYEKLGLIVGLGTFVSYFLRFIFGLLSDYYGISKPFLLAGYGLSAVSKPLLAIAEDWKGIALFRVLDRLGKAIRTAPKDRLLSLSGAKKQGKTFGFHQSFDVAGKALGALISFLALIYIGENRDTYRFLFLASAIPGFLALLFLLWVDEIKTPPRKDWLKISYKERKLVPLLIVMSCVYLFMFSLAFFLAEAKNFGYSEAVIPLLYILTNLVETFFGYPFGALVDKTGIGFSFISSIILGISSLFFLLKGFVTPSLILFGFHEILYFNSFKSFIGKYSTNKGTLFGFYYFLFGIFGALGSYLIGYLINNHSLKTAFLYSSLGLSFLTITFAILYYVLFKPQMKS
jgi:MFS family permease